MPVSASASRTSRTTWNLPQNMSVARAAGGLQLWVVGVVLVQLMLCVGGPTGVEAGRVLGIFYFPGRSHFSVYEPLLKELAARGHQVDVVSHFPQKEPLRNYRDLSLAGTYPSMVDSWSFKDLLNQMFFQCFTFFWETNVQICRKAMEHPVMKELTQKSETYDVVIVEIFGVDCAYGYAHKIGAPVIGFTTSFAFAWGHERVGNPDNPAYVPMTQLSYIPPMNLWQRIVNTGAKLYATVGEKLRGRRLTDELLREQLGADTPPLSQLLRKTSLVMVNSHFSLSGARPTVPAFVEVGGLHIDPKPGKLPEDLQAFLDGAGPSGVVLVSFGSLSRAETMPPAILQAFLKVLGSLPQRVVWRINGTRVPGGLPRNVVGSTWIPQNALLSHPKMKAFVSHGGLGGTMEAVYWGVPVVVVPFFTDHQQNGRIMEKKGCGRILQFLEITEESLGEALNEVLSNPSYRENVKKLSKEFRDRPQTPLETAVFWTEYVMRHKGAPQLRSAAVDLAWYQLWLLDVAATLVAAATLLAAALWLVVGSVWRCLRPAPKKRDTKKSKVKAS